MLKLTITVAIELLPIIAFGTYIEHCVAGKLNVGGTLLFPGSLFMIFISHVHLPKALQKDHIHKLCIPSDHYLSTIVRTYPNLFEIWSEYGPERSQKAGCKI